MSNIGIVGAIKPNRKDRRKDKLYHSEYGEWVAYAGFSAKHEAHMSRIKINMDFFSPNKQWEDKEDLEVFLQDTDGQASTRIKVELNQIQIMVNQNVGNANQMNITARAESYSPMAKVRRDEMLSKMLFLSDVANASSPEFSKHVKDTLGVGANKAETETIFSNIYVDKFVEKINSLLRYSETHNKFNKEKKYLAEDLSLTGMAIMKPYLHSNDYKFKRVRANRFFFDRSAHSYDLSDAGYMGTWDYMLPSEIYERYSRLDDETVANIENFVSTRNNNENARIKVYDAYWRDVVKHERGYVKDIDGTLMLEWINHTEEGSTKPKFTDKDVVSINEISPYQKSLLKKPNATKGKAKAILYADQWRFCTFIRDDAISSPQRDVRGNIVLDYGVVPFQEPDIFSGSNMLPPFKVGMYIFLEGDVYAPVDIAINPQRLANRLMSVIENQINNSRGSGTVYDSDMVEDEATFLKNMNENKPVAIRTKGLGITNAIGRYDNTVGAGAVQIANFAQLMLDSIQKITGVNDALKGQTQGDDQLVGVMQLQIQRGSIVQERFYAAIKDMYEGCYQAVATSGKRFYIENNRQLVLQTGDNTEVVTITKDMKLEDFRVSIVESNDPETERLQVDTTLMKFVEIGFLDKMSVANLLGRATKDEMYIAVRKHAKKQQQLERMADEENQQLKQQAVEGQQASEQQRLQLQQQANQQGLMEEEKNRQNKIDIQTVKNIGGANIEQIKNRKEFRSAPKEKGDKK